MAKTVRHPSTQRLIQDVAKRFLSARSLHTTAAERMWLGILVAEFTDDDIAILRELSYLCPRDEALIKAAKR
jgi:hypothetical protein